MLQRLLPLGALALLPLTLPLFREEPPDPLAPDRDVATLLPERSLVYVEASGLGPLLEKGLEHPFVRRLMSTELGRVLLAEADQRPEDLIAFADHYVGRPVLPALARLSARGAALGVAFDGGIPRVVVVLHGEDEDLLVELVELAFERIEEKLGLPGALDEQHRTVRGAHLWNLGENTMARRGTLLVLGNDEGMVRDVLDLAADSLGRGMLGREDFRELAGERTGHETIWAWADLERLEPLATDDGLENLRAMNTAPAAHALLGPGVAGIASGSTLAGWVAIEEEDVELGLVGHGVAPAAALLPGASDAFAPPPRLAIDGALAEALVYRDYAGMFRERVALFPPETLPGFSEQITNFALFFGGRDLSEDVLPGVSPWLRVVVRPIEFEAGRVPEIPLPGVAFVAELADPSSQGPQFASAFQTVVGLMNVDRAQKGGGAMQLSLGLEGGVEVTSARFLEPGPEDGVDVRYNLQPACAVAGGALVLGTHEDVVRAVVRELAAERHGGAAEDGRRETLMVSGAGLAQVVADNLDALVMNEVLEKGVTIEEAEENMVGLRLVLAAIDSAQLELDYGTPRTLALRARLALADPARGETR